MLLTAISQFYRSVFTICVLMMIPFFGYSQLNIKTGLSAAYFLSDINKKILTDYNSSQVGIESEFGSSTVIYGIQVGLRYKTGPLFWELSYQNIGGSMLSSTVTDQDVLIDKKLFYRKNQLYLGLEHRIKRFGYGATIGFDFLKVSKNTSSNKNRRTILTDRILNSKFFFNFVLSQSDVFELSIRPFVQISWEPYFFGDLNKDLNPDITKPGTELTEKTKLFGISVIFFNGPQG